jgi:hypothetical protein
VMSTKAKDTDLLAHTSNKHVRVSGASDAGDANSVEALQLWRTIPAHEFSDAHRAAVVDCIGRTSSTIDIWRKALRGDASLAVYVALTMRVTEKITNRTDLTMTLLLNSALAGSAGAALVLSFLLRKLPLASPLKNRLATSWVLHNFRTICDRAPDTSQRRRRKPRIALHFLGKEESES